MQTNYETHAHMQIHSVAIFQRSASTSKPTEISDRKKLRPTVRLKNEMKFVFYDTFTVLSSVHLHVYGLTMYVPLLTNS